MIRVAQFSTLQKFEEALNKLDMRGTRIISTHVGPDPDEGWYAVIVYRVLGNLNPLEE